MLSKHVRPVGLLFYSVLEAGAPAAAILLALVAALLSAIIFKWRVGSGYVNVSDSVLQSEASLKTKHRNVLVCAAVSVVLITINVALAIVNLVHLDDTGSTGLSAMIAAVSNLSFWVFFV